MTESPEPLHPLFRLATLSAGVFIVTVFAMIATLFGDQQTPLSRFLNEHAGTLISVEVVVTLALGFAAMAADRRRTRRELEERAFRDPPSTTSRTVPTNRSTHPLEEGHGVRDSEGN